MDKVVVIGESGQLASCFRDLVARDKNHLAKNFQFLSRSTLDLSKPHEITKYFASVKPDIILNLAAYTQVDKAESERETAYAVNALASQELARACERYFYISTDYVYSGNSSRPYLETDPVSPVNYYGETKLAGEILAQKANPNTFVVRTSWVYSQYGVNFVKRMAELGQSRPELKVVADQIGSPTWAPDLAAALLKMIQRSNDLAPGIYNYSNEGQCSWYDFAVEILKASGSSAKISPIKTEEYPTPARRPAYSVLDKSKIKSELDINIPTWRESFEEAKKLLFK